MVLHIEPLSIPQGVATKQNNFGQRPTAYWELRRIQLPEKYNIICIQVVESHRFLLLLSSNYVGTDHPRII